MTRVLVVEDEECYSDALSYMLRKEGYDVAIAATGPDALTEFDRNGADIVLLDLMLPGLPGTEVCRQLRQTSNVPVIMVSAKDDEVDKVVGLELGADDYVTKPYSPARAGGPHPGRAAPRPRARPRPDDAGGRPGPDGRRAPRRHRDGVEQRLPLKEFELLEMFLRNAGRVLTRASSSTASGAPTTSATPRPSTSTSSGCAPRSSPTRRARYLVTVRGLGYKLDL